MACTISCMISAVFVIGMIYFYNITDKSEVVKHYKQKLSSDQQKRYEKIVEERTKISYTGYILGLVISLFIIFYNMNLQGAKLSNTSVVCVVIATSFLTNYFYYTLSPKTDWMLNHMNSQEEVRSWLQMYRAMQYNYHMGIVFGIIAVGVLAYAFRC